MLLFCKFSILFTFIYISFNNCKYIHLFTTLFEVNFKDFFAKKSRQNQYLKNIKNRHKTCKKGYKKSIKEPKNRLFYADFYKFQQILETYRKLIFLHIYLYIFTLRTARCRMPHKCKARLFPALYTAFYL